MGTKSQITAELIRATVGVKSGRALIDQLAGPMNLVLPAYGITTEHRIAAFLATAAPESDWFKTLREYGHGKGRAYGRAINGLIYYGRGIFQVTWLRNYKLFTEYVAEHWSTIKLRAAKYKYTVPPDFVAEPELLATPYWAVEAACWYWKSNGLAKYADRGLKGFYGLQGLVNRGDAEKKALHYEARLGSYEVARRVLPDDFELGSAADASKPEEPASTPAGSAVDDQATSQAGAKPSINNDPPPNGEGVVVEKEENLPLWQKIKTKIASWLAAIGGTGALRQYQDDIATLGVPMSLLKYAVIAVVVAFLLWLLYEVIAHAWLYVSGRWLTTNLVKANTTPTNVVRTACPADIEALEAAGWTVVRRG